MNQIVKAPRQALEPSSLQEAIAFSQMLARSTMIPSNFQGKAENVLVAVQWGREIGLGPLQALQNIAVINGRPSIWGDAMLALVRGSGLCEYIHESVDGDGEAMIARCATKRRGEPKEEVREFSVADAKKASLWGKSGPWAQYPKRMLQLRARGFCLRDVYPDVLRGVISAEEARDMPEEAFTGQTIEAKAEYPAPMTMGEQIGDAIPEPTPKKKRTMEDAIVELEAALDGADTADAVEAVITSPKGKYVSNYAENGALKRWNEAIEAAHARFAVTVVPEVENLEPPSEVDAFLSRLKRMGLSEVNRLDTNAEYKAWVRDLAPNDYQRVLESVSGRVAELRLGA